MFKQNENGKKKVSKIKPLSTTASPAGMRIKDGKHDTEHNSKGRSFLFLSPHLSLSTFVRSINTTLATQAPFIITSQLVLFPFLRGWRGLKFRP